MKQLLALMLLVIATSGCSKEGVEIAPEEVALTVNYSFAEGESMSRASSEVYASFYDSYIKNKNLAPTTYTLTFTNASTGAVSSMSGLWKNKDIIRLIEGEYIVSGVSAPIEPERKGCPSDTVYLAFNENIYISKDMTSLNLNAIYDSYLLMFDKDNCKDIYYFNDMELAGGDNKVIKKNLKLANTHYVLFIKDLAYGVYDDDDGHYIKITRNDGGQVTVDLDNVSFEKGKYYYFNDMTSSFNLPVMENGN